MGLDGSDWKHGMHECKSEVQLSHTLSEIREGEEFPATYFVL